MNNHPIEGRLRDALAARAQTFSASPDAWQHVQAKDARLSGHRRGRSGPPGTGWLARHSGFVIPAAAAATVAAVALSATALAHGPSRTAAAARHTASAPAIAAGKSPTVSVQLVLPSSTIVSGSTVNARLVIDNHTGHAIHFTDCGLAAVLLQNQAYHPQPAWAACLMPDSIPPGVSVRKIKVFARGNTCTKGTPAPGLPACGPDGLPPALPPGTYHARTFYDATPAVLPSLPGITVRVVPSAH